MQFIDTHAHIYLEDFKDSLDSLIEQSKLKGLSHIFMPNIDHESIADLHRVADNYSDMCFPMMGLHPCYVKHDSHQSVLKQIENQLEQRDYCAIGEIGIDLYWDKSTGDIQEAAFRRQINWAKSLGLPIAIHSREALDLTIQIVEEMQDGMLTGVFHCFNGDLTQAKRIIDVGFYMGIGGVVTFKKAGVDRTVADINLDHLILETDAPYLAPTPYRGKQNTPEYIPIIAHKIAEVHETTLLEVANKTTTNAKKLFPVVFNEDR